EPGGPLTKICLPLGNSPLLKRESNPGIPERIVFITVQKYKRKILFKFFLDKIIILEFIQKLQYFEVIRGIILYLNLKE
ncbi:MAG: hypothetical protein ACTSR2_07790, partial [Candidatus Hodarchaeales archaeon]